ncbi:hypothetical protein, partial [Gordonia sihwensis]|uniref:hypothetical protein n=1 Tax=Gordonia sihwensis TaxID=173559 RepID=UPI003D9548E0
SLPVKPASIKPGTIQGVGPSVVSRPEYKTYGCAVPGASGTAFGRDRTELNETGSAGAVNPRPKERGRRFVLNLPSFYVVAPTQGRDSLASRGHPCGRDVPPRVMKPLPHVKRTEP